MNLFNQISYGLRFLDKWLVRNMNFHQLCSRDIVDYFKLDSQFIWQYMCEVGLGFCLKSGIMGSKYLPTHHNPPLWRFSDEHLFVLNPFPGLSIEFHCHNKVLGTHSLSSSFNTLSDKFCHQFFFEVVCSSQPQPTHHSRLTNQIPWFLVHFFPS